MPKADFNHERSGRHYSPVGVFTCPDCNGVMWEIKDGDLTRYRCHVGHAYTAELMSLALDENLKRATAIALRTLDERVALVRKLQKEAEEDGSPRIAKRWKQKAEEVGTQADVLRRSIARADRAAEKVQEAEIV